MFTVLNRDYKQTEDEIEKEFPDCRYVMKLDGPMDKSGYLLALSDSIATHSDLCAYAKGLCRDCIPLLSGEYREERCYVGILRPVVAM